MVWWFVITFNHNQTPSENPILTVTEGGNQHWIASALLLDVTSDHCKLSMVNIHRKKICTNFSGIFPSPLDASICLMFLCSSIVSVSSEITMEVCGLQRMYCIRWKFGVEFILVVWQITKICQIKCHWILFFIAQCVCIYLLQLDSLVRNA